MELITRCESNYSLLFYFLSFFSFFGILILYTIFFIVLIKLTLIYTSKEFDLETKYFLCDFNKKKQQKRLKELFFL